MRSVGDFNLSTRLSAGDLGDVFLALPEGGGAPVALTLVHARLMEDLGFARALTTEAPAAIALEHPAVVQTLHLERGLPETFFVREFVQGQPFGQLLRRARQAEAPLPQPLICWIGAQLAEALDVVHARDWFAEAGQPMVHGALSPRSLMLGYDGRVCLLGVGVGRAKQRVEVSSRRLPYLAPELLLGKSISVETDAYGLGLLLYEAITGRSLFRRGSADETRAAIREAAAPPLSARQLSVDPALSDWVARLMAPRRHARPSDLAEVSAYLRSLAPESDGHYRELLAGLVSTHFEEERTRLERRLAPAESPPPPAPPETAVENVTVDDRPSDLDVTTELAVQLASADAYDDRQVWTDNLGVFDSPTREVQGELLRLGRYRLETTECRTMGLSVVQARDPNLSRWVRIELLDPRVLDDELVGRRWTAAFKAQARLMAGFSHPSFPIVHDAGRAGPLYFIVVSRPSGVPLAEKIEKEGPLAPPQALQVLSAVVEAVTCLHDKGVLHGSISAQNSMIDDRGRVNLCCLMSAHLAGDLPPWAPSMDGVAPECKAGQAYDQRTEQFAVGRLFYRLLTGVDPFGPDPDLQPRPPAELDARVPPEVSQLCMRLLAPDPADRFTDMYAALGALLELETALPLEAPSPPAQWTADPVLAEVDLALAEVGAALPADDLPEIAAASAPLLEASQSADLEIDGLDVAPGLAASFSPPLESEPPPETPILLPEEPERPEQPHPSELHSSPSAVTASLAPPPAFSSAPASPGSAPPRQASGLPAATGFSSSTPSGLPSLESPSPLGGYSWLSELPAAPALKRVLLAWPAAPRSLDARLAAAGFEVHRVGDGHQAWSALRAQPFSHAVLQEDLPGRSGVALAQLCASHPDTERTRLAVAGAGAADGMAQLPLDAGPDQVLGWMQS